VLFRFSLFWLETLGLPDDKLACLFLPCCWLV